MKIASSSGWGDRAQIQAAIQDLQDVKGNRDGLWNNETKSPGTPGGFADRQPLLAKFHSMLKTGIRSSDEVDVLKEFRHTKEAQWGRPVTDLDLGKLRHGDLFAAQKAIALDRLGRTPSEVTEGFVKASGSVDGEPIASRDVFWQRFKPIGEPSGKVVVVSPGFQETGRNFYEQIDKMNRLGHDVIVMDHQWAGHTEGQPGSLDRGFGVARDVAAMAAHAQGVVQKEYQGKPGAEVVLFGNSMGAGPGVLGALVMNDNGKIKLDGPPMPQGLKAVLQSPFLGATPNKTNDLLALASSLPLLNRIQAPSAGVPVLTTDPIGAQKGAQTAIADDVRAQLRAMSAAEDDLDRIQDLLASGQGPKGRIFVVHGDQDPLADPAKARRLGDLLGPQADVQIVKSKNHVFEQNPGEQDYAIRGLQSLLRP